MRKNIIFLLSILFIGCRSTSLTLDKVYKGTYKGYYVGLDIKSDSTFTLTKSYVEYPQKCSGRLSEIDENKYLLKCDFEDPNTTPTPRLNYLEPREHIITVLNKKKVRLEGEDMILKKVK
jgi:hypothetical protein